MALWVGFIFGTSCTVIRPQEFFELVQRYAIVDEQSMQHFRLFWGLSWFAIVKGWHFTEFVILTFLVAGVQQWWRRSASPSTVVTSMLICITFAASDEWHQSFVPDRFGTVTDVFIDSLGVMSASMYLLIRSRSHREQGI